MATPVTKGYYRFTDIIFEWHQVLPNQEDVSPLKALLHYEALVHPDHPLRKPGVDGIELFLGTFPNGEARLLFSLDQIEYIRYWLHAMELTKELIPIPGGDYLIQQSDMSTCAPDVYNNPAKLKRAVKTVDKNNKRLRGSEPLLHARRLNFEKVRAFWADKAGTWIAMDFEAWEYDHKLLTEFGWSLVYWEDGDEVSEAGHLIVHEHRTYTNGKYVKQNRDNYSFGQSEDVSMKTLKSRICDLINTAREQGPVFLVFHDPGQDIKYLREIIEAPITGLAYLLPDTTPSEGLYVLDTAELFAALEGSSRNDKRGLEQICRHLQIPVDFPHNAGNDAHYALTAAKFMASGEPCDAQREKRWPHHISATEPKAVFPPWEEDSNYSDTEGLFPVPSYSKYFENKQQEDEE